MVKQTPRLVRHLRRESSLWGLRRQLRRELDRLQLEPPVSITTLVDRLAAQRGRPLHLMPMPLDPYGPSGLWIATGTGDYVCYQQHTTRAHQDHIIAHEVGHMLVDHPPGIADNELLTYLVPDLSPELIATLLRRDHDDSHSEREAEDIATLLLQRSELSEVSATYSARAARTQAALAARPGWV
ncbi:hypothetical protein [Actinopolyspora halophila]|uniref:hypothetical protein n=1 Tax=Actinopolyspora halophila TaxID=1850 RepID=UPI00036D7697|nr:hypothetical protein [Actinopolyspora halophila]